MQADDGTSKRNGNAEEWRENNGNIVSRIYWGLPKLLFFPHNRQFSVQSINAAVKVFTSIEGKSFQNWFVITDASLSVCSA